MVIIMNHFCEKCGNEIKPEDKYCAKCGNGVNGTTTIKETNTNPYTYRALAQKSLVGHFLGLVPLFAIAAIIFSVKETIASISGPNESGVAEVIPIIITFQSVFLVIGFIIILVAGVFANKMYSTSKKEILELGIEEQRKFYDYKKKAHLYIGVFLVVVAIINMIPTFRYGIYKKRSISSIILACVPFIGYAYNVIKLNSLNKENKKKEAINNEQ